MKFINPQSIALSLSVLLHVVCCFIGEAPSLLGPLEVSILGMIGITLSYFTLNVIFTEFSSTRPFQALAIVTLFLFFQLLWSGAINSSGVIYQYFSTPILNGNDAFTIFLEAYLVTVAAVSALLAGFHFGKLRTWRGRALIGGLSRVSMPLLGLLFFVVGISSAALFYSQRGGIVAAAARMQWEIPPGAARYYILMGLLIWAGPLMMTSATLVSSKVGKVLLVVVILSSIVAFIGMGRRSVIVLILLYSASVFSKVNPSRARQAFRVIGILCLVLSTAIIFTRIGYEHGADSLSAIEALTLKNSEKQDFAYIVDPVGRFGELSWLLAIDTDGYEKGQSVLSGLIITTMPVINFLSSGSFSGNVDQNVVDVRTVLSDTRFGRGTPKSTLPGMAADLYFNFSVLGVVVFFGIVGFISGKLKDFFYSCSSAKSLFIFLTILRCLVLSINIDTASFFSQMLFIWLPVFPILLFCKDVRLVNGN